jgi:hypothetical protein
MEACCSECDPIPCIFLGRYEAVGEEVQYKDSKQMRHVRNENARQSLLDNVWQSQRSEQDYKEKRKYLASDLLQHGVERHTPLESPAVILASTQLKAQFCSLKCPRAAFEAK